MRRRYISLDASPLGTDPCTPEVEPGWTLANAYVYNTCVPLTVSVDPYLMPVSRGHHFVLLVSDCNHRQKTKLRPIYWRLKSSIELEKVTEQLQLVRPPLEAGLPIQTEDRDETIDIKKSKRRILHTVFAEIGSLTPTDARGEGVVWTGRHGWLKEYNQIGSRRDQEQGSADDTDSSEEYDSDYIYDSISPVGERRKSCTVLSYKILWT
jgi:hypothetical protein